MDLSPGDADVTVYTESLSAPSEGDNGGEDPEVVVVGGEGRDLWAAALVVLVGCKKEKCSPPAGWFGPSLLYRSKLLASSQLGRRPTAERFSAAVRSGVSEGGGVGRRGTIRDGRMEGQ